MRLKSCDSFLISSDPSLDRLAFVTLRRRRHKHAFLATGSRRSVTGSPIEAAGPGRPIAKRKLRPEMICAVMNVGLFCQFVEYIELGKAHVGKIT